MNDLAPHPALVPIAEALGVEVRGVSIVVPADAVAASTFRGNARRIPPIEISLELNSGVVQGLSYTVSGMKLPAISLRIENPEDKKAKASGINREVQTGDAEFDEGVYIDSEAPDSLILAALASADARRAILDLVGASMELRFNVSGIHATRLAREALEVENVRHVLAALGHLAASLPSFAESDVVQKHSFGERRVVGWVLVGIVVVLIALAAHQAERRFAPLHAGTPFMLGMGGGGVLGLGMMALVKQALRGRSDSSKRIRGTVAYVVLICSVAGFAAVVGLNGLLDSSEPLTRSVVVVSCTGDEDHTVTVRIDGGETADVSVRKCGGLDAGRRLWLVTRSGAFGWEWVARLYD